MKLYATRNGVSIPGIQSIQVDRDAQGTSSATITAQMSTAEALDLSPLDEIAIGGAPVVLNSEFEDVVSGSTLSNWAGNNAAWNPLRSSAGDGRSGTYAGVLTLAPGTVVAAGASSLGAMVQANLDIMPGDAIDYVVYSRLGSNLGFPAGVTLSPVLEAVAIYTDGTTADIVNQLLGATTSYTSTQGNAIAPLNGKVISRVEFRLWAELHNTSGSAYTVPSFAVSQVQAFYDSLQIFVGTRLVFGGYLNSAQIADAIGRKQDVTATLACRDYKTLTDSYILTKTYETLITDQAMIQDAFAAAGLTQVLTLSSDIRSIISLTATFDGNTLSEVMDQIAKASGAIWFITADKHLHYATPDAFSTPAPFALSDTPDNVTTFKFNGALSWKQDFYTPATKAVLYGGLDSSGNPIVVTSQDSAAMAKYGTFTGIIRDNSIRDTALAQAQADAYVAQNKNPKQQLTLTCFQPGLIVGQSLNVTYSRLGWSNKAFAIQKISIKQDTQRQTAAAPYRTWYDLTLGDYRPSLTTILAKQQSIINPVFNPVPPYTPAALATYVMQLYDGAISAPGGIVDHWETIVDITNTSGNLQSISAMIDHASLGNIDVNYDTGGKYYIIDSGGNPAEIDVYVEITIDGQTPVKFTPIASQQPSATQFAGFNRGPVSAFTPGYNPGGNSACSQDASMGMLIQLPFATSLKIRGGYEVRMTPSTVYTAATVGGTDPSAKASILYSIFFSTRIPG